MFKGAIAFNQPLGEWQVHDVVDMSEMFRGASSFNQPLAKWDVISVTDMTSMFQDAVSFNQPLVKWHLYSIPYTEDMFKNSAMKKSLPNGYGNERDEEPYGEFDEDGLPFDMEE